MHYSQAMVHGRVPPKKNFRPEVISVGQLPQQGLVYQLCPLLVCVQSRLLSRLFKESDPKDAHGIHYASLGEALYHSEYRSLMLPLGYRPFLHLLCTCILSASPLMNPDKKQRNASGSTLGASIVIFGGTKKAIERVITGKAIGWESPFWGDSSAS